MPAWPRLVTRHRWKLVALWVALALVGGIATGHLADLTTNRFSVPGAESERGLDLLKNRMGERSDGAFTLVFRARGGDASAPAFLRAAGAAAERGARAVREGKAAPVLRAG